MDTNIDRKALEPMLYLVATPIGNMEDITLRALRVLGGVSAIYCEDTRHSGAMLAHLNIKKPLVSCHEHNESARAKEIVARVQAGEAIAYISDAGMPAVSDPGARLVSAFIEAGAPYTVVPGASALTTALALSGFPSQNACFVGFLPRAGKERRDVLALAARHTGTLVFYESPLRVSSTAKELADALGPRPAALCRELTKLYEETVRGTLSELAGRYADTPPKGECVLVVGPAQEDAVKPSQEDAEATARSLLDGGLSAKDASRALAEQTGLSKNEAYSIIKRLNGQE